jgi:NTE family protein
MGRKRIAIACQGGGSQCAFVAGALDAFFTEGVHERFQIVGLSGTSGGAFTAALAWMGLLRHAHGDRRPIGESILACWKDLTAQTPQEIALDRTCTALLRLAEEGYLPSVATSPSAPRFQMWQRAASMWLGRPEFTDLRALLEKHIDFAAIPGLVQPDSPVMLAGAGDVLDGRFKTFSSALGEIKVEALLASAAIPTLYPAVWVDGHAYWDGIFSSNPPIFAFLQKAFSGKAPMPEEIWIIQINRAHHDTVPERPADISDRRNHLAGNLSLQHELQLIDMVNLLIQEGALTDRFRARMGVDIKVPITVRFVRMSQALQEDLDYPSKLSRLPTHIARLIADGESQARAFLAGLREEEENAPPPLAEALLMQEPQPAPYAGQL